MYPRILYVVVFGWLSWTGGRFTAPFLQKEVDFSETQVGVALAIQNLLMSLMATPSGHLADRWQRKRDHGRIHVLQLGMLLSTCAFLGHWLPGRILPDMGFPYHLFLRVLYAIGIAMVMPVVDGITLAHFEANGMDRSLYGRERLFGAVSWMVAHGLIGPIIDAYGFKLMYGSAILGGILSFLLIYKYTYDLDKHGIRLTVEKVMQEETSLLQQHEKSIEEYESINATMDPNDLTNDHPNAPTSSPTRSTSSSHKRGEFFWLTQIMCGTVFGMGFMISYFTLMMGVAVVEQLIFIFFDSLGSSNTMCGLTVFVTVMFEIPLFHYAPFLLDTFGSGLLMYVACFAYVTRVIGYTLIPDHQPYWVLLLEPLHGVTYACAKTSSVEFVAALVPTGHEAAGQGLLFLFRGLGSFCGVLLGGALEDWYGSRVMYRALAAIVGFGLTVYAAADRYHKRQSIKT